MKVLFVVSGNNQYYDVAPFIRSQGESLAQEGIEISYFPILGKGMLNYLKNVIPLRKYLKNNPVDVVHAHYSLCGWVAVLAAGRIPVVLSYMGDDLFGSHTALHKRSFASWLLILLGKAVQPFLSAIICKSQQMADAVSRKSICHVVPNGVRLEQFKLYDKSLRKELGLDKDKKYVLFLGDPSDNNKNVALVEAALEILNRPDVELLIRYKVSHDAVVKYLNAVDVFTLCSFSEGSPNVVKEAMACNCPMVVTKAGDAAWVVGDMPGCYVSPSYEPEDFAQKLRLALQYAEKNGRTKGRERLLALGLDAKSIAEKVIGIYQTIANKKRCIKKTEATPVHSS
ncbi:MAG: D-inositol-3-phosphate glycosyltransferase [Saprospiraceae bacterium]|nr:D-inositol-3-phosphate glycosyltransferase [Saprospiraceae bacterium]